MCRQNRVSHWRALGLVVAMGVLPATGSTADASPLSWLDLSGFFGVRTFSADGKLGGSGTTTLSNSVQLGVRGTHRVWSGLRIDIELPFMVSSTRDERATAFVLDPRVLGTWDVGGRGRVRPFLSVGVGMPTSVSPDTDVLRNPHVVPEVLVGAGARFVRRFGWNLRFDARVAIVPSRGDSRVTGELDFLVTLYRGSGKRRGRRQRVLTKADLDTDGDGITDDKDECIRRAEDVDQFEDADGCPDIDDDRDEVLDIADKCRLQPETANGYKDDDGCPDEVPDAVTKFVGAIRGLRFHTGSAVLARGSRRVLDSMVAMLRANPTVRAKIIGYTDNTGDPKKNNDLALDRAESVMAYLVGHGVDSYRLMAMSEGPDDPIADNDTARGRAKNRRVEFALWFRVKR